MMMKKEPKCSVCPDDVKSIPKNLKKYQVGTPTYSGGMLPMATVSSPMSESPIARNLRVKKALQEGRDVNTAKTANERGFENTVKELSGAGSVERIYKDPVGTLKGTGIAATNVLALPIGVASGIGEVAQGREFDMGQNPFTGRKISEGFDKALDVATVLPAVGLLGKGVGAAGKAARTIPAVDRGVRTASRAMNATESIAEQFIEGVSTKNPSSLFEAPVSTLSPERLKYLKEVNRLSAYGDEVKAASNQKLIAAGDPSAATKKQLFEKYLQSPLTEEDLYKLSGMDKARLKHELSLMNIVDEPKIKKAIDPNFPDYSQNVGDDLQVDRDLIDRYGGIGANINVGQSSGVNIRPMTSPPRLRPAEMYTQPRHSLLESINLQRPVNVNRVRREGGRGIRLPSKADQVIDDTYLKYQDATYNLGVGFKEALTKKLKGAAPVSEFVEGSAKRVRAEPLLSALFKQGNTSKEVMQKISEAKQAYINAEKGSYKAAGSLSSNSFPLYTTMISNVKKSVPNTRYSIDGFGTLNGSGYIDQLGGSNEEIAGFLNDHLSKLNLDGKKIPKVFVKNGQIMYPKINLEKYKLGGYTNKGDGKGDLPKFRVGGAPPEKKPRVITNLKDFKVAEKAYNDSSDLYISSIKLKGKIDAHINKFNSYPTFDTNGQDQMFPMMYPGNRHTGRILGPDAAVGNLAWKTQKSNSKIKPIKTQYFSQVGNLQSKYVDTPDAFEKERGFLKKLDIYKKPVEQVIYKPVVDTPPKPSINPEIVAKQKLIGVTPDGVWGKKSEAAWQEYNKSKLAVDSKAEQVPITVPSPITAPTPIVKEDIKKLMLSTEQGLGPLPITTKMPNSISFAESQGTYSSKGLPRFNVKTRQWEKIPEGWFNKGEGKGIEDLPKFQLGEPVPTKQQYQDSIQTNYQPYLEKTKGASPLHPRVENGHNCIYGVCNFIKGTNAHKFEGKAYSGNATFNNDREKNGYYEADWKTSGFEVGDVVQYSRFKENALRIDGMKITPKNAKELYPQHAEVILKTRVDNEGKKWHTIGHNEGKTTFKTSEVSEKELMKHGVEGYKTFDGLIVNRYDPEKVKENKAALLARQAVFQGNNEHASKYNTPPNFIYKGAKGAKSEQNMVDYFKKNYQALGRQSNMSPETLHKAFTNIVGIGHQESDLGGNMEVKMPQFLMDEARTLRDALPFQKEDDWKKDYWKSNADGVQSKYKSEAEFKKALASRSPISPEVSEYLYLNSPRSKGTFKQKELSERGRFFNSNLDSEEKQFVSAMQLYMDNYDVVKKKYPGKTDDEYLDLTTLMHNAPSKALTPEYVEYYQKNNKMDYVNKVKAQRGELVIGETFKPSGTNLIGAKDSTLANATPAPRIATPTKLSPKEVETLKAFMSKK